MAKSYKRLVSESRKQFKQLKALGIQNDALTKLESQLKIFYSKPKRRKTSLSGISITKSMDVQSRKEMSSILRQFLKEPKSRVKNVIKDFKNIFEDYKKIVSTESATKIETLFKNASPSTQSKITESLQHRVQQNEFLESLGSDVLNELYHYHMKPLNLDTETIEHAIANVLNSFTSNDLSDFDTFEKTDLVLQEYVLLKGE